MAGDAERHDGRPRRRGERARVSAPDHGVWVIRAGGRAGGGVVAVGRNTARPARPEVHEADALARHGLRDKAPSWPKLGGETFPSVSSSRLSQRQLSTSGALRRRPIGHEQSRTLDEIFTFSTMKIPELSKTYF